MGNETALTEAFEGMTLRTGLRLRLQKFVCSLLFFFNLWQAPRMDDKSI